MDNLDTIAHTIFGKGYVKITCKDRKIVNDVAAMISRKVKELETENDILKDKIRDLNFIFCLSMYLSKNN